MKLIVGLGNPGEKYARTRHNVGFMVLDRFLRDYEPVEKTVWKFEDTFKSEIAEIEWKNDKVILVKPQTYMNNSGLAVGLVARYWKLELSDIWIVHDDIDLPVGKMKIRVGGGSAGHRGIESIIKNLGKDTFVRFRMGIGKPFKGKGDRVKGRRILEKVDDYVLSPFLRGETHEYRELIKKGSKALQTVLEKDIEAAMNQFNAK